MSKGIIPREVAGYGLPDCLRITIGTEEENLAMMDAMREFMGDKPY
jgi:histidinol-phosphate aminotransferase